MCICMYVGIYVYITLCKHVVNCGFRTYPWVLKYLIYVAENN